MAPFQGAEGAAKAQKREGDAKEEERVATDGALMNTDKRCARARR